jgi:glycosyltransferase involved in cell wall biosynthesis
MQAPLPTETLAIFLPSLAGGGAERMMLNLAAAALEIGVAVELICADGRGPYRRLVPAGCGLVDLGAARVSAALTRLVDYLRRRRPAALLAAMDHANLVAIIARLLAGIPGGLPTRLGVSVRSQLSVEAQQAASLRGRLLPVLARWLYPRADVVSAVSRGVADDLVGLLGPGRARIEVVPNPVVTPELDTLAAAPVDHPWLAPGQPPVLLAAGRLVPQKDFATLIGAFSQLVPSRDLRLLILGEGPLRGRLQGLIERLGLTDRAALPGFVENPFAYMARARLFVLSSAWEGLPGVLIQAMACGTPVVSTDCPSGPREILAAGRYGPLVAVGDASALAAAVARTLDVPPSPQSLQEGVAAYRAGPVARHYLDLLQLGPGRAAEGAG